MNDTLGKYGHSFQIKAIGTLYDPAKLSQVHDVIKPDFFNNEALQWIVKQILFHYSQHKTAPSLDMFHVYMNKEIKSDSLRVVVEKSLGEVIKSINCPDNDAIFKELSDFSLNRELKDALIESVDLLQVGKYELIRKRIDRALRVGQSRDLGLDLKRDLNSIFDEALRRTIPTPWDPINDLVQGGFGGGELIVLVAGPGGGKSMALVNLAAYAFQQGKKVVYYTLELKRAYVAMRFCAYLSGIQTSDLQLHLKDIQATIDKFPGELFIKHYDSGTASLATIDAHLQTLTAEGFKPDMVIIDYADLLKIERDSKFRSDQDLGNLYVDLRGLAGKFDIPIFTASQANRSSAEQDVIHGGQIASSFEKLMVADFVISLARKTADKLAGTGRWHIIKSRFGPDGMTFPSKLHMATCKIQIFNDNTPDGQQAHKDAQHGESLLKANLKNKFRELMPPKGQKDAEVK